VNESVGFDAGKQIKGRKRFLMVETLGLVMRVFATAASTPEREGAQTLLARVKALETRSKLKPNQIAYYRKLRSIMMCRYACEQLPQQRAKERFTKSV
jgi:hypothetical protein